MVTVHALAVEKTALDCGANQARPLVMPVRAKRIGWAGGHIMPLVGSSPVDKQNGEPLHPPQPLDPPNLFQQKESDVPPERTLKDPKSFAT